MWPFRRNKPAPDAGALGEAHAARLLKRQGLKILARNYRCPAGEADLIALDKSTRRTAGAQTICFVEVKTRSSDAFTDPASAVDADKQRRLVRIARYYLAHHPAEGFNVRFDVVTVLVNDGRVVETHCIPEAFSPAT
ncbi:MAG: YraN family protein [Phycisphaerae bacterium]